MSISSYLICAIFGLAFFQGVLTYIGIPQIYHSTLLESLLVILFFIFILHISSKEDKLFNTPSLIWFFIFTLAVFASALINSSDSYTSIRMYSRILSPYLFFLSVLNLDLSQKSIRKINKLIFTLIILQIPAALYKYGRYGVVESILIGTFNTDAGELSTIFPLFIIGYLVSFYLCYKKNPVYLLLIPGFMFFAWGGGKRAFFIFMPTLLLIAYYIYNLTLKRYKLNILKLFFHLILLIIVIGTVLYFGGRLNPVFNPEGERWGTFDLSYMMSQTFEIQSGTSTDGYAWGRISTTHMAFDQIIKRGNLTRKLFGDGPDRLYLKADHREDYRIRYGITGAVFYLISTGLVGTLSIFFFYLSFGVKAYKYLKKLREPFYIAIAFGTILAIIIFCFDFLFHGTGFIVGYTPSLLFFFIAGILLKHDINSESKSLT